MCTSKGADAINSVQNQYLYIFLNERPCFNKRPPLNKRHFLGQNSKKAPPSNKHPLPSLIGITLFSWKKRRHPFERLIGQEEYDNLPIIVEDDIEDDEKIDIDKHGFRTGTMVCSITGRCFNKWKTLMLKLCLDRQCCSFSSI